MTSGISWDNLELILFIVSTTILCCDCLPVKNKTCLGKSLFLAISIEAANEAAVFPIPVGAAANRNPFSSQAIIPSVIIFSWALLNLS